MRVSVMNQLVPAVLFLQLGVFACEISHKLNMICWLDRR